jgi:hypothetical protein
MTTDGQTAFLPAGTDRGSALGALQELLTRTVDAQHGFDRMLDKAEADIRPVVQKFRATHAEHADRIAALIAGAGGTPDMRGGVMSTVNRTVVSLRAMFDGIDADVMSAVREGERSVLNRFDDALAALPDGAPGDELVAMRDELIRLLDGTFPPA